VGFQEKPNYLHKFITDKRLLPRLSAQGYESCDQVLL